MTLTERLPEKTLFWNSLSFLKEIFFLVACLIVNLPYILLFYLKLFPNHRLKERFFGFFFKGKKESEIRALGAKFSLTRFPELFYPSAKIVLDWHRNQDHLIVFLTASSPIWLKSWCEQNGIYLVGTEFESENGSFTGFISGKNCYGIEKISRIKEFMEHLDLTEIDYAYGDSKADHYFLELAKNSFHFALTETAVKKNLSFL